MGAPCRNAFISRWKDSSAAVMRQTRNASSRFELVNSVLEAGSSINWKATSRLRSARFVWQSLMAFAMAGYEHCNGDTFNCPMTHEGRFFGSCS